MAKTYPAFEETAPDPQGEGPETPSRYVDTSRPISLSPSAQYPYGADLIPDCRDTAGAKFAIQAKAEMDGISEAEAERQINEGAEGVADYVTPRFNKDYGFNGGES